MFRNGKIIIKSAVFLCMFMTTSAVVFGQSEPPAKPKPRVVQPVRPVRAARLPRVYIPDPVTSEKAISVDPNVSIKVPCISQGNLKINGWERNEVRVFIKDGTSIGFKVLEKNAASGKPNWILISSAVPTEGPRSHESECISGTSIEIDVPMNAGLNLYGRETETVVDSVRKVSVKNIGGNISLRNIAGGIMAETYEGDVTVENSGGSISLQSSTGNIVAFEVSPGQIGDLFKAKTHNGAISLQKVEHRQIDANSISGTVMFNGKFLSGGQYSFKTSNGSIRMTLPQDSSCTIAASYGFGSFNSDIPLKVLTENIFPGGKNVVATIGSGEATVNLTTNSGSIGIKKQ